MPGLEHLPFAEVWLHEPSDEAWRAASDEARAIGKDGLEVWTTDATPEVVAFLETRGYETVRRYGFPSSTSSPRPTRIRPTSR